MKKSFPKFLDFINNTMMEMLNQLYQAFSPFKLLGSIMDKLQNGDTTKPILRPSQTFRPTIGILSQESQSPKREGYFYIDTSYIDFLHQAGALVVLIETNKPKEYYEKMLEYTNGLVIPGGMANIETSEFGQTAELLYNMALEINRRGVYYPVWGACLGFEAICCYAAGSFCLEETDAKNLALNLDFTPEASKSRMFKNAPADIMNHLATERISFNNHRKGVLLETFNKTKMSDVFYCLSTNKDRNGVEFVSTIEAKEVPFYGVQWHPEKVCFWWDPYIECDHSEHAVKMAQYLANFFISEVRKNDHRFPDKETLLACMVQNIKRVYIHEDIDTAVELYLLNWDKK